jgi:SAM-dependent methyltransferase
LLDADPMTGVTTNADAVAFWGSNQPGFRFSRARPGTLEFFDEVEAHRYELEPHIPEIAQFARWTATDVLEVGCGIATDGLQFARAGARYTGVDQSEEALTLARKRFDLHKASGRFESASATALPFADESFDLVYSHGVIHHIEDTRAAVEEFHRVLRPGGTALIMVYHRGSLNYRFSIMILRRVLAALLLLPGAPRVASRLTGEGSAVLEGHRVLLRTHGTRYLRDSALFLSNNTDGPGNPLSKVYSRDQARALFAGFQFVETEVRYLNLRLFPAGERLAATRLGTRLERSIGWHLYVRGRRGRH